jgi:hypothetical protein
VLHLLHTLTNRKQWGCCVFSVKNNECIDNVVSRCLASCFVLRTVLQCGCVWRDKTDRADDEWSMNSWARLWQFCCLHPFTVTSSKYFELIHKTKYSTEWTKTVLGATQYLSKRYLSEVGGWAGSVWNERNFVIPNSRQSHVLTWNRRLLVFFRNPSEFWPSFTQLWPKKMPSVGFRFFLSARVHRTRITEQ